MIIGISIDGVLRNLFGKMEESHMKYFPKDENEEDTKILDYDFEKWLIFPEEEVKQGEMEFNPEFNEKKFIEENSDTVLTKKIEQVTIAEFLYEKCTLEVFGYANEVSKNIMEVLNGLILEFPQHEFIIISREIGLCVPSTLFFLSKTSCMCQNIKFVKGFEDHWDYVDMMVTDHPKIINSKKFKPQVCVKIKKDFNKELKTKFEIESLKEFGEILKTIK